MVKFRQSSWYLNAHCIACYIYGIICLLFCAEFIRSLLVISSVDFNKDKTQLMISLEYQLNCLNMIMKSELVTSVSYLLSYKLRNSFSALFLPTSHDLYEICKFSALVTCAGGKQEANFNDEFVISNSVFPLTLVLQIQLVIELFVMS